ncbi:MAG: cyclic nucleotide-binding domain-containing protein [Bacteroidales bacterium]|nr:cyclic nucleotide-binding domain-containing protein [Bacteroidales bacterium]
MITLKEKYAFLGSVPIFSETGEEVLLELASVLKEKKVLKGSAIMRKGDDADAVFIIASGKVRVHDGNHVLARLNAGEVFGEYALIDKHTRSASVTAEENCLLLTLGYDDFYRIAAGNPNILRGVLKELVGRMREMNELEEKLSKSFLKIRRQKELIEKQSENISRQKDQLEQQNFDLTKLNEEKNHLISMVIHQIKNPLTSSLCMAEMLLSRETNVDETEKEGLSIIRNSVKRINNLLNEILDLNTIESKVYELKTESLDLHIILDELIENYRYFIEQKGITLEAQIMQVKGRLNRVYITQIFDNLLSNTVKYTGENSTIAIKLQKGNNGITFIIEDEGPGISVEKAEVHFNQYRRQLAMNEQDKSTDGLGLAIVHKYTTAMDGEVKIDCNPDEGTRFTVILPSSPNTKH